jgi:hypothetical protein
MGSHTHRPSASHGEAPKRRRDPEHDNNGNPSCEEHNEICSRDGMKDIRERPLG